jgi:NTE family protein
MINGKKVGLALSGGGYRAAAFHLGTLRRLNKLGVLNEVDVISSISGGSIANAYYLLHKDDFDFFSTSFEAALQTNVIWRILTSREMIALYIVLFLITGTVVYYTGNVIYTLSTLIVLLFSALFFQHKIISLVKIKARIYDKIFFKESVIDKLPIKPLGAINATNLETGTLWTFSKAKCADSSYSFPKDGGAAIEFNCKAFPIAQAVAASSTVPGIFNPVIISSNWLVNKNDYGRVAPTLIDGGIYDNQGIHKLTEKKSSYRCNIIICSDSSMPFRFSFAGLNFINVFMRANDVMMRKVKSLQFIRDVYQADHEIAYYSLDWTYERTLQNLITSLSGGRINHGLLNYYDLPASIYNPEGNVFITEAISNHLKNKVSFETVIKDGLSNEEIAYISTIGTNLTALPEKQIELLTRHAEILTELFVRLYCPSIGINL